MVAWKEFPAEAECLQKEVWLLEKGAAPATEGAAQQSATPFVLETIEGKQRTHTPEQLTGQAEIEGLLTACDEAMRDGVAVTSKEAADGTVSFAAHGKSSKGRRSCLGWFPLAESAALCAARNAHARQLAIAAAVEEAMCAVTAVQQGQVSELLRAAEDLERSGERKAKAATGPKVGVSQVGAVEGDVAIKEQDEDCESRPIPDRCSRLGSSSWAT
eukprot:2382802-Prymnesium_polylepis.1